RVMKAGRSVVVSSVDFTSAAGDPLAVATASFMAAPDPGFTFEPGEVDPEGARTHRPLRVPLAERARCTVVEPGVAMLPRGADGLNAVGAINGGLIGLVVEEAARSTTPGASLCSMAMRFLRSVRVGPAVATATVTDGLGRVEVSDAGDDDRLAVVATTRAFAP